MLIDWNWMLPITLSPFNPVSCIKSAVFMIKPGSNKLYQKKSATLENTIGLYLISSWMIGLRELSLPWQNLKFKQSIKNCTKF